MFKYKNLAAALLVFGSLSASANDSLFKEWIKNDSANPVAVPTASDSALYGSSFYVIDPTKPIEFTFVTTQAGHDLNLAVSTSNAPDANWQIVFSKTGNSVGNTTYTLNNTFYSFDAAGATEIFLSLHDRTTGQVYYTDTSRNTDGIDHSIAFYDYTSGKTLVGFEDLYDGGDRDYDDIVFLVSNVSATPMTPVPEPETYAMLLAGLGLIGAVAQRRSRR